MPLGLKKGKISCIFCGNDAEFVKMFDDHFCPKCLRFQKEIAATETKLLPIFKLKKYIFVAQKYTYYIYNDLESKIGSCEWRDLSKLIGKKDFNIRFYFFNDINRIIGSIDSSSLNDEKGKNATWKIYDYGRFLKGEIRYTVGSDTWQIFNPKGEIIASRDPQDSKVALQTARLFTIIDANNPDKKLFSISRKAGFYLTILSEEIDPHLAWGTVICIHRKYYL